jgi:hypothetical protein
MFAIFILENQNLSISRVWCPLLSVIIQTVAETSGFVVDWPMITDITEIMDWATLNTQDKAVFLATAQQTVLPRVRVNTWDELQLAAQHSGNIKMIRTHEPCSRCFTVVLLG